jgi:hypothetical protein
MSGGIRRCPKCGSPESTGTVIQLYYFSDGGVCEMCQTCAMVYSKSIEGVDIIVTESR